MATIFNAILRTFLIRNKVKKLLQINLINHKSKPSILKEY